MSFYLSSFVPREEH